MYLLANLLDANIKKSESVRKCVAMDKEELHAVSRHLLRGPFPADRTSTILACVSLVSGTLSVLLCIILCFKLREALYMARQRPPPPNDLDVNDPAVAEKIERRQRFVLANLAVSEWTLTKASSNQDCSINTVSDTESEKTGATSQSDPSTQPSPGMDHSTTTNLSNGTGENICAICLCDFEELETVCHSCTESCRHIFHRDCMLHWLIQHGDCPVCRRPYLPKVTRRTSRTLE